MTKEQRYRYDRHYAKAMEGNNLGELTVGFIRYEALRKLNTRQFAELSARNLKGEPFDDLVDGLITGEVNI